MVSVSLSPVIRALLVLCSEKKSLSSGAAATEKKASTNSDSSSSVACIADATEFLRKLGETKFQLGLTSTGPLNPRLPLSPEEASQLEVIPLSLVRKLALYHQASMESILRQEETLVSACSAQVQDLATWEIEGAVTQFNNNKSTRGKTVTVKLTPFAAGNPLVTLPGPNCTTTINTKRNPVADSSTTSSSSSNGGLQICATPLSMSLTAEKVANKRRLALIEGLMEDLEYEKMVSGSNHARPTNGMMIAGSTGKKISAISASATKEALARKHGHLFANKGSKEQVLATSTGGSSTGVGHGESMGVFMRDMSIGLDVRLMSLSGAVVGYYLCWSRGQNQNECIVGAAVGAIFMMFVDAVLLIRMGREDKLVKGNSAPQDQSSGTTGGINGAAAIASTTSTSGGDGKTQPIILETSGLLPTTAADAPAATSTPAIVESSKKSKSGGRKSGKAKKE